MFRLLFFTGLPNPVGICVSFLRFIIFFPQVRDFEAMKGIDYEETNTYRAFLPFDTPIRKIGFCPERRDVGSSPAQGKNQFFGWVYRKVKMHGMC